MSKVFMPDLSVEERLNIMRNNADKVEETNYERDLTPEEVDIKRETLVDNLIAISGHEEKLDEAKAEFKKQAEPLKQENKKLQREVKYKKSEVEGLLFHMANHDDGMMEVYDQNGECVGSRRLRPDEKRQTIPFVPRVASGE